MFIFFQICTTILTLKVYTAKNLKFHVGKTQKKAQSLQAAHRDQTYKPMIH